MIECKFVFRICKELEPQIKLPVNVSRKEELAHLNVYNYVQNVCRMCFTLKSFQVCNIAAFILNHSINNL